jgi:hypothetical protein
MSQNRCPSCHETSDYGPGPCPKCACRTCRGAAFFTAAGCEDCGNSGVTAQARATHQRANPENETAPLAQENHEHARKQLQYLADILIGPPAVAEAELAAHGLFPVTVLHGHAEKEQDTELIFTWLPQLARQCGVVLSTSSPGSYTTFIFTRARAGEAASAFLCAVEEYAPSWWRVTPSTRPPDDPDAP